jgi:hypothetical protein
MEKMWHFPQLPTAMLQFVSNLARAITYFGKTKVIAARTPKSDLLPSGAATCMRGPTTNETICDPNLVTPDTVGFKYADVVSPSQFWVISELMPTPAPLFQL